MNKKTKDLINKTVGWVLKSGVLFLVISFILMCANFGLGIKLNPPFCWASFLQLGILLTSGWAFNKELFYY
jgi:hypothetical protein